MKWIFNLFKKKPIKKKPTTHMAFDRQKTMTMCMLEDVPYASMVCNDNFNCPKCRKAWEG